MSSHAKQDVSNNKIITPLNSEKTINKEEQPDVPFWTTNPNILLNSTYIFEFYPADNMTFNQKLNAVSRTILFLTIVSFLFTFNLKLLVVCFFTLLAIFLLFKNNEIEQKKRNKEGFDFLSTGYEKPVNQHRPQNWFKNPTVDFLADQTYISNKNKELPISAEVYQTPSSSNPLSNVLISDYDYNPNKKPAPPSYNENVNKDILKNAKQLIQENNPGQPDISEKLFKDLGEQLNFEQSMRPFYSTASTTIPNDQTAFAEFCFGSMVSAKEGNMFAATRNLNHYNLY